MKSLLFGVWVYALAMLGVVHSACGEKKWDGMTPVQVLQDLPAGITLPVYLLHGVKAGSSAVGAPVEAVTTEPVPLSKTAYLPQGTKVIGVVVKSRAGDRRAHVPAELTIAFNKVRYHSTSVTIQTRVLAVANAADVSETFASTNDGSDRGNASPANWTTRQIGGDQVYREGWEGPVENGRMEKVGYADFHGVYAYAPHGSAQDLPRAVGVFSTDAQGLYGFDDRATLLSSGSVATVRSPGQLILRNGDALLLQISGGKKATAGGV
jgi:hypothetical protein